jgi:hypothetical protein
MGRCFEFGYGTDGRTDGWMDGWKGSCECVEVKKVRAFYGYRGWSCG